MRSLIHNLLNLFADASHVNNHPEVRNKLEHGRQLLKQRLEPTMLKSYGMSVTVGIAAVVCQYSPSLAILVGSAGALAILKNNRDSDKANCYLYLKVLLAQPENADRLNTEAHIAFLHGVQAGRSYFHQFRSNLPNTSAYKHSEAYYAGLEAAQLNDLELIEIVESRRPEF